MRTWNERGNAQSLRNGHAGSAGASGAGNQNVGTDAADREQRCDVLLKKKNKRIFISKCLIGCKPGSSWNNRGPADANASRTQPWRLDFSPARFFLCGVMLSAQISRLDGFIDSYRWELRGVGFIPWIVAPGRKIWNPRHPKTAFCTWGGLPSDRLGVSNRERRRRQVRRGKRGILHRGGSSSA